VQKLAPALSEQFFASTDAANQALIALEVRFITPLLLSFCFVCNTKSYEVYNERLSTSYTAVCISSNPLSEASLLGYTTGGSKA
jgi:hypothetical protein